MDAARLPIGAFDLPRRCELHSGRAFDVIVGEVIDVPAVDLFGAGCVRNSVSTENTQKDTHSQCIADGFGQTGETFHGVLGYTRRSKPQIVICEDVSDLLRRTRRCEVQMYFVRNGCEELGYAFAHMQVGASKFLVPQRRTRVWIWAIRLDVEAAPAVEEVRAILSALERPQPVPLDRHLRQMASDTRPRHTINVREQEVFLVMLSCCCKCWVCAGCDAEI